VAEDALDFIGILILEISWVFQEFVSLPERRKAQSQKEKKEEKSEKSGNTDKPLLLLKFLEI
jgi:hypothetical protein